MRELWGGELKGTLCAELVRHAIDGLMDDFAIRLLVLVPRYIKATLATNPTGLHGGALVRTGDLTRDGRPRHFHMELPRQPSVVTLLIFFGVVFVEFLAATAERVLFALRAPAGTFEGVLLAVWGFEHKGQLGAVG